LERIIKLNEEDLQHESPSSSSTTHSSSSPATSDGKEGVGFFLYFRQRNQLDSPPSSSIQSLSPSI